MSIDAASSNRTTPLWEASSNGHMRIVQFLVEKGADFNAFDAQGNTPLYIALSREDYMFSIYFAHESFYAFQGLEGGGQLSPSKGGDWFVDILKVISKPYEFVLCRSMFTKSQGQLCSSSG